MRNRISGTDSRLTAVLVTAVLVTAVLALGASASGGEREATGDGSNGTPQSTAGAQPDDSGERPGSAHGPGSTADFEPSDGDEGSRGRDAIPTGGASTADPK